MDNEKAMNAYSPIGIFDSGFGGLTVLNEIRKRLPFEDLIFIGDSERCPYGPRDLKEVESFVLQICQELIRFNCKMIVIACNTGTAAGLRSAQMNFNIPIVGVVEPGARAAVHITRKRKIGVIATEGTVRSNIYENAIKNIDAGIDVTSIATPEFVDIVESGLAQEIDVNDPTRNIEWSVYRDIVERNLSPLIESDIDTLVLGCTHFPIIEPVIRDVLGPSIKLVSSAEETSRDVLTILKRRGELSDRHEADLTFFTTSKNAVDFSKFGSVVLGESIEAETINLV